MSHERGSLSWIGFWSNSFFGLSFLPLVGYGATLFLSTTVLEGGGRIDGDATALDL